MALAVLRLAGPGADNSFAPLRSAMVSALKPLRTTNCSIFQTLVWLLSAMYMATPGFFTLAFSPSSVTRTAETSIWLVIIAATLGGPPINFVISGSMFCSLKNPRSSATKYGSEELTGNTPTVTLSWAATRSGAATLRTSAAMEQIARFIDFMVVSCHSSRGRLPARRPVRRLILGARIVPVSLLQLNNRDHRTAAMRALMHGVNRHEHCGVADRQRRHAAHRRLGMAVMMDIGIIQHDLAPPAQRAPAPALLPSSTICAWVSSTPEEQDATDE